MEGYVIMLDQQTLIQIAIQIVNTIILCFILNKLLYTPVTNFLAARKKKIADEIDSAQAKLDEADKLKAEYEAKLKSIDGEKREILEAARAEALKSSQQIVAEAKAEADVIKKRAMTDIEREQNKAKDEIKNQIIEVSSLISSRFISAKMTKEEQDKLIDDTISGLEDVEWIG